METSKEALEQRGKDPQANPPVEAGEAPDQTLGHLFSLQFNDQLAVLDAVAPRILERLDGGDIDRFIESLRGVPMEHATLAEPDSAAPIESRAKVERDILEQPLGAQKRILELAAPRIVAQLEPAQRAQFLEKLRGDLERMSRGIGAEVETETRH